MKIDIRDDVNENITQIYFEDNEYITQGGTFINIVDDNCRESVEIHSSNIDNLIKALQKAKELWYE